MQIFPHKVVNKIHCGNCAHVLRKMVPDQVIDLTVTSPPYDDLRAYEGFKFDWRSIIKQLWRITKIGGVVVWVVADQVEDGSETGTSFQQAIFFQAVGFRLHDTMIYRRAPRFPDVIRYPQWFEYMFVFSKGPPKTFNPICDRKNTTAGTKGGNRRRDPKTGEVVGTGQEKNVRKDYGARENIWTYLAGSAESEDLGHPAKFPDQLAMDHILSWSDPGDLVLDPMCGSGTTCAMAKKAGREYVGIDISENYCQIARGTVESHQLAAEFETGTPSSQRKPIGGKGLL